MAGSARSAVSTVIPTLRYKDVAAAIEWLCNAFGFEKHLVMPGENGAIAHAQLVFGNGMIMLGSATLSTSSKRRRYATTSIFVFQWSV